MTDIFRDHITSREYSKYFIRIVTKRTEERTVGGDDASASRKALDAMDQDNGLGVAHCSVNEVTSRGQVDQDILRRRVTDGNFMDNIA